MHRCLITCKGNEPDMDTNHWEAIPWDEPKVLVWADIASSTVIEAGALASHNDVRLALS